MRITLHTAVYRAFHAQENKLRPGMARIGLSVGQPKVLRYLSEHDRCMQKDIAEALDIEPATVSRLAANMEQAGLVTRAAPAACRRAESVSITQAGQAALEKWTQLCGKVEEQSLQGFNEDEQAQFIAFLARMYQNLTGKKME